MICDRCGYAVGVLRVLVMVEGRVNLDARLCIEHLNQLLDQARPDDTMVGKYKRAARFYSEGVRARESARDY